MIHSKHTNAISGLCIVESNGMGAGSKKSSPTDLCHCPFPGVQWPCTLYNGGCDDLCDTDAKGRVVCTCADDKELVDGFRCISKIVLLSWCSPGWFAWILVAKYYPLSSPPLLQLQVLHICTFYLESLLCQKSHL